MVTLFIVRFFKGLGFVQSQPFAPIRLLLSVFVLDLAIFCSKEDLESPVVTTSKSDVLKIQVKLAFEPS